MRVHSSACQAARGTCFWGFFFCHPTILLLTSAILTQLHLQEESEAKTKEWAIERWVDVKLGQGHALGVKHGVLAMSGAFVGLDVKGMRNMQLT